MAASSSSTPAVARSVAAYHLAALKDTERLTDVATAEDVNRLRDKLLLRAPLSELPI